MLRALTTSLLYHGKIKTTEARAKEIRRLAEKLITTAIKEKDNFDEIEVKVKTPKKDAKGRRMKTDRNGKRVTEYYEVTKKIKKDHPSRLFARRKILAALYPVTEAPKPGRKNRKPVDMAKKLFEEVAARYSSRQGGYTRIIPLGARHGDGAEEVIIELV
ncbi:MAG: 50S ribosomal protein L17 [Clostridiales bacterium]|nr:50S ribosomal protein L17 [Clostridiales bacterium]